MDEPFCYLTTTGRVTGRPHRIEIWFATDDGRTLYLLAGGGRDADWVQNLERGPAVTVEVGGTPYPATARVVERASDEEARARRLLLGKYQEPGRDNLERWGRTALPIALDLHR